MLEKETQIFNAWPRIKTFWTLNKEQAKTTVLINSTTSLTLVLVETVWHVSSEEERLQQHKDIYRDALY